MTAHVSYCVLMRSNGRIFLIEVLLNTTDIVTFNGKVHVLTSLFVNPRTSCGHFSTSESDRDVTLLQGNATSYTNVLLK